MPSVARVEETDVGEINMWTQDPVEKKMVITTIKMILKMGTPQQKDEMLEMLFSRFDEDGSGEIDMDEFRGVLRWLQIAMSEEVTQEIFLEVDEDQSGQIELPEFIKFFEVVERYQAMFEDVERDRKTKQLRSRILNIYFIMNVFLCGFFSYQYIETKESKYMTLLGILGTLLGVTFLVLLVIPVLRMKHGATLQKYADSVAAKKSRIRIAPSKAPKKQLDQDRELINKIVKSPKHTAASYRIQNRKDFLDEPRDPENPSEPEGLQLESPFGKPPVVDMDDDELADELRYNQDEDDQMRYEAENYHLSKLQQDALAPSTFHPMGTSRYRGMWARQNNPTMTVQGTAEYVGKTMRNTNMMQAQARHEGLDKKKIENIKLNSTISSGWYAGSCSPYGEEMGGPPQQQSPMNQTMGSTMGKSNAFIDVNGRIMLEDGTSKQLALQY